MYNLLWGNGLTIDKKTTLKTSVSRETIVSAARYHFISTNSIYSDYLRFILYGDITAVCKTSPHQPVILYQARLVAKLKSSIYDRKALNKNFFKNFISFSL